jgi:hypothetical protein
MTGCRFAESKEVCRIEVWVFNYATALYLTPVFFVVYSDYLGPRTVHRRNSLPRHFSYKFRIQDRATICTADSALKPRQQR